ncbi:hypothetical protein LINPERPRIM_LOCUS30620 [Linum perenne]
MRVEILLPTRVENGLLDSPKSSSSMILLKTGADCLLVRLGGQDGSWLGEETNKRKEIGFIESTASVIEH